MKKAPKAKKETLKSVTAKFEAWRVTARGFMYQLQNPVSRQIISIEAADAQGKLNGMTVVELIAITNLLSQTGEKLYLVPQGKSIVGYAVADPARAPQELL
jgi:hypothetical protein